MASRPGIPKKGISFSLYHRYPLSKQALAYNRKLRFQGRLLTGTLLLLVIFFFGLWAFYGQAWAVYFLVPVVGFTIFSWFTLYVKKRKPRTGKKTTLVFFDDKIQMGDRIIKYTELQQVRFDNEDDLILPGTQASGVPHVKMIWTLNSGEQLYITLHFFRDGWNKAGEPYNVYELFSLLRTKDHFLYKLFKEIREINFMNQPEKLFFS